MANILAKENETLSERKAAVQHFASVIYKIVIFGALFVVVLALPLAFVVPRSITKPLAEGARNAGILGRSDLIKCLPNGREYH